MLSAYYKNIDQNFSKHQEINRKSIETNYANQLKEIRNCFQNQYSVFSHTVPYINKIPLTNNNKAKSVIISAIHKNLYLFQSSIDLSVSGMYGPARTLLRPIYEALLIAKFCAESNTTKIHNQWVAGQFVHVTNHVFNKFSGDQPKNQLENFWKGLHQFVHSSTRSQQVSVEYNVIENEILFNISMIHILLYCNYHLIKMQWINNEIEYYIKIYGEADEYKKAKTEARTSVSNSKKQFTVSGKSLVHQYCKKWKISNKG